MSESIRTRAASRRTKTLSEIQDQCRHMAFDLSFSISRLREVGEPAAARRMQDASIIVSSVAGELEPALNEGESRS